MQQHMQDKKSSRVELLQAIFGQAATVAQAPAEPQQMNQGFEIYTGLDYSLRTAVTTNTISVRNA
ncbi:hypothetical protein [Pseudomonas monsensis]